MNDRGRADQHDENSEELAKGAESAALKIVLRTLVEHATTSDPDLRVWSSVEADPHLTDLAPQSAIEKRFVELTRDFVGCEVFITD